MSLQRFLPVAPLFAVLAAAFFAGLPALVGASSVEPPPVFSAVAEGVEGEENNLFRGVLRIENSTQIYDYRAPWNAGRFSSGTGTGFVIGENLILTNAHVVSNSRRLLLRMHGDPGVFPARILHIAHDCDLALLELEDPTPIADIPPFEFGDVPPLDSEVRAIGYPIGGERVTVTRGVVSRIDFSTYSHSGIDQHLVIQIDAAINPGNSGGPVLRGDKVIGVAFQGMRDADNTGYIIPTPVVRRFLDDVATGSYDHYVDLAIGEFNLINPAQRRALGLDDDGLGILVTRVAPGGSLDGHLKSGDVLLAIDEHPVFANGQVLLDGEMLIMHEVVERKFDGDTVDLTFLRDGSMQSATATLSPFTPARLFQTEYETRPRYAVFAGLVFQPLSRNLIASYSFDSIEIRKLLNDYIADALYQEQEDFVILAQVLPDEVNSDIAGMQGLLVESINGEPVTRFDDVINLLIHPLQEGTLPEFVVIECRGANRPLVFESSRLPAAQERIRRQYGLERDAFAGPQEPGQW